MSEARDPEIIAESLRQAARLSALGWYHSIELPDGGVIEGHQTIARLRERLGQFHIPEDLTGKRVLDIGAWDGWFSFEMERRGAEVLALDSAKNTRLLEAKRLLGSKIEYRIGDICRLTWRELGQFDIVLFLGVLYHVKHPVLALENVCGMTREMACIESFVSDGNLEAPPAMEFYEGTELRGQLDNWVGPNVSCLMAFCRAAGFARVDFESVMGERAHVTGYRHWLPYSEGMPEVVCVDNANTHDHRFASDGDDYVTFYFAEFEGELYPEIGAYAARPIHRTATQATVKLPPGLGRGWHEARLNGGAAVRIGVDAPEWGGGAGSSGLRMTRIADGKVFEDGKVYVGQNSCVSVWAQGLPAGVAARDLRLRLNGTDLPAIWYSGETGQVNALVPSGMEPGAARISLYYDGRETAAEPIQLI